LLPAKHQTIDLGSVLRPLLDLVKVARIRKQRIVGFFVGPVAHYMLAAFAALFVRMWYSSAMIKDTLLAL
jgi:hypothetical protein